MSFQPRDRGAVGFYERLQAGDGLTGCSRARVVAFPDPGTGER